MRRSAELYDPLTNSWSAVPDMGAGRYGHTATVLANGKVLVAGGDTGSGITPSAELYDPAANSWSPVPDMSTPRWEYSATRLENGTVLVAGGDNGGGPVASAQIYDPAGNSWSPAPDMGIARRLNVATRLYDGKVLVAGGDGEDSPELYDPEAGEWSSACCLSYSYSELHLAPLANGKVLLTTDRFHTAIYDAVANAWSERPSIRGFVLSYGLTGLADGRVLMSGGVSETCFCTYPSLSTTSLYSTADGDFDGDGVADSQDAFPLDGGETVDSDADMTGDGADGDDDNDGIPDAQDAYPTTGRVTVTPVDSSQYAGAPVQLHMSLREAKPVSLRGRRILVSRTGVSSVSTLTTQDGTGRRDYAYQAAKVGDDVVSACFDRNANATCDATEPRDTATVHVLPARSMKASATFDGNGSATVAATLFCDPVVTTVPKMTVKYRGADLTAQTFTLSSVTSRSCSGDGSAAGSPTADFNTLTGTGTGAVNGHPATIAFSFTDRGEPGASEDGTRDVLSIQIDAGGYANGNLDAPNRAVLKSNLDAVGVTIAPVVASRVG